MSHPEFCNKIFRRLTPKKSKKGYSGVSKIDKINFSISSYLKANPNVIEKIEPSKSGSLNGTSLLVT